MVGTATPWVKAKGEKYVPFANLLRSSLANEGKQLKSYLGEEVHPWRSWALFLAYFKKKRRLSVRPTKTAGIDLRFWKCCG